MDMVLSFLISAGIIAFGVWVVVGTITAGWPLAWTIMGLLAILVGVLSLYGSVRDARTPEESCFRPKPPVPFSCIRAPTFRKLSDTVRSQ